MILLVLVVPLLVAALLYGGREVGRRRGSVDLRRLAPLTGGTALALAVGAWMVGGAGSDGAPVWLFVVPAVVLTAGTLALARRGPVPADFRWTASAAPTATLTADDRGTVASAAAVARALGRVEARELSRALGSVSAPGSACSCWPCSGSCGRARTPAPGTASSNCRRGSPSPWSAWWFSLCTGP